MKIKHLKCDQVVTNDIIIAIVSFGMILEHLDIQSINSSKLIQISKACRNLKYLHISSTYAIKTQYITDVGMIELEMAEYCEQIESLSIADQISDESVSKIVERCHHLHSLNLPSYLITDSGAMKIASSSCLP